MSSLVVMACLVVGFGAKSQGTATFRPTADEERVPALFRLERSDFPFETETRLESGGRSVLAVRFPSPIVSPDPDNNTVHAEYFQPAPTHVGRRPAVVVLHILGADFALSRYLASRLADRGVGALFVKLPYYGERRPAGQGKAFLSADIERSMNAMKQGVCDVRRAAAWLASRPEIDPKKVGVTGISLGGIVASLAVAVDPALDRGAFLLAGGDLARVLWEMPEGVRYRAAWERTGRTLADLKVLTDPYDPLRYAKGLEGKRILMIAGNVDEVIPPASARSLWEAAGRPKLSWYDCGHYSAAGYLLPAIREAVEFLAADADAAP